MIFITIHSNLSNICCYLYLFTWYTLQWRHNGHYGVSNHQPHDCLLNRLYSGADQRKHQSSASLAFARGIHRWPVNSPHKGPVPRKMFPFDDVIIKYTNTFACVYFISAFVSYGLQPTDQENRRLHPVKTKILVTLACLIGHEMFCW